MGISERKERERQEMRSKIIEAATAMFVTEGYEKTSIRNIAERIEYSPATIYLYYSDKDELLYEVQKQAFGKLEETFARDVTSNIPLERLTQICHSYVRFGKQNPQLYELMFTIKAPMNNIKDDEAWKNNSDSFQVLADCLKKCIDAKLIRFTDLNVAAMSVWAMGHGLVSLDVSCRLKAMQMDQTDIDKLTFAAVNNFLQLIKA